jgi:CBS domain-containing protein
MARLVLLHSIMRVDTLMSTNVATCTPGDTTDRAARLMSDLDCGAIPVVDEQDRVVGIVTDRDICLAAMTHAKCLSEIPVGQCMIAGVVCVAGDAPVEEAARVMRQHRVRRLPVIGRSGRLVGMLSIDDLAVAAANPTPVVEVSQSLVAETLAAVCEPAVTTAAE